MTWARVGKIAYLQASALADYKIDRIRYDEGRENVFFVTRFYSDQFIGDGQFITEKELAK
jgi:hypothetical protein